MIRALILATVLINPNILQATEVLPERGAIVWYLTNKDHSENEVKAQLEPLIGIESGNGGYFQIPTRNIEILHPEDHFESEESHEKSLKGSLSSLVERIGPHNSKELYIFLLSHGAHYKSDSDPGGLVSDRSWSKFSYEKIISKIIQNIPQSDKKIGLSI